MYHRSVGCGRSKRDSQRMCCLEADDSIQRAAITNWSQHPGRAIQIPRRASVSSQRAWSSAGGGLPIMNAIIGGDEWIGCDIYVCVPCETPPWGAERGAQNRNRAAECSCVRTRGRVLDPTSTPENTRPHSKVAMCCAVPLPWLQLIACIFWLPIICLRALSLTVTAKKSVCSSCNRVARRPMMVFRQSRMRDFLGRARTPYNSACWPVWQTRRPVLNNVRDIVKGAMCRVGLSGRSPCGKPRAGWIVPEVLPVTRHRKLMSPLGAAAR